MGGVGRRGGIRRKSRLRFRSLVRTCCVAGVVPVDGGDADGKAERKRMGRLAMRGVKKRWVVALAPHSHERTFSPRHLTTYYVYSIRRKHVTHTVLDIGANSPAVAFGEFASFGRNIFTRAIIIRDTLKVRIPPSLTSDVSSDSRVNV